ncbi:MAG TPA: hypothetical protein VMY37_29765 [Thermoguttaceae bacterium]|nr:hypothetical protein [Thermoguttaceae bacterium]
MAKKKGTQASHPPEDGARESVDGPDDGADRSPEVTAAEEAVLRAEAELTKAQAAYARVRRQATEQLKRVREKRLGDLVDDTLKLVKRHPGPSVVLAAVVGFWLGRLFRR